ncbi:MAG: leucyl aminopeptidase [Ignavibacteriae bacterium]|nr:leucyl aminopeptidase [Ignavibacteriota bacterium]
MHILFFVHDDILFKKAADAAGAPFKAQLLDMRERGDFLGKAGESISFVSGGLRFVLVGLGTKDALHAEALRRAAGRGVRDAMRFVSTSVAVHCPTEDIVKKHVHISFEAMVQAVVEGTLLGAYKFDKYLSKQPDEKKTPIKECKFVTADEGFQGRLKVGIDVAATVCDGVELARNLTNAPPNEVSAETLAKEATAIAKKHTFKAVVLGRKEIEQHKMSGLLAVNQGSKKEPRFIIMEYNETKRRLPLYVLVGKGVTFDSGGLSIKPAAAMEEMKMDMAGAAAVLGTMQVIAKLKLPVRVVALIPATDNMSGGGALCPGDIIRYSNGTSVEVLNTDAEGRLILADALIYAQRYKPAGIIDLATLTGACVVALASYATGMMGTGDELKDQLRTAGDQTSERVWELPLYDEYSSMLKSNVADLKNIGGRWGGAITAAAFLKAFTGDVPWVHLDIAGTAILDEASDYAPKGGSGVGVRLLTEFFRTVSEKN